MDIRPSPIAGTWYPGDPDRLRDSVDNFLRAAPAQSPAGELIALIAPHAGHKYSGAVAGRAFALARGMNVDTVAVVSPMHQPYDAPLLTTGHEAYATPLGIVEVDRAAVNEVSRLLENTLDFGLTPVKRDPEHSLEIELPFLQRVLPSGFRLIPIMVRDQIARVARALGLALAEVLRGRPALLVASSDLSHFYPQTVANALDAELLACVAAFDPQGVLEADEEGKGFACGKGAIAAVLWAARELGGTRSQVVGYATSGDVTGDFGSVVGYGAAAVWKEIVPTGQAAREARES